MKIWLVGEYGMLGRAVSRAISRRATSHGPIEVIGTDLDCNICDPQVVEEKAAQIRPSVIINCAAYTHVDNAESSLDAAMAVNARGPEHLAVAARTHQSLLIHISTDYVFDGTGKKPYLENDVCSPLGVYGQTKFAGEEAIHAVMKADDRPHYILRTSWLFGQDGGNFVKTMLGLMHEKETLQVVSDQIGRPTYCEDLAERILLLVSSDAKNRIPYGTYHFANRGETSWHGFAKAIFEEATKMAFPLAVKNIDAVDSSAFPRPAPRPAYSVLDTTKIEKALAQQPRPWREALCDYLQHIKESSFV
jgi:dTDP-4-dehydrorhamnose reductase